ncbi:MAG: ABC transporter [Anaerolineaceae bacterium 4572_78]|nr:MAG: ABC transporter [Anaerolineaceae bacterium 4572_78]
MKLSPGIYIHPLDRRIEIQRFWSLLWALVAREFKGRYRRSILGPLWAVLQPLFYMVIFTFLRGVLDIPSDGVPYIIFTYSALVPWTFFAGTITRCGPSVSANSSLVKKIALPREIFPAAGVMGALIDFCIAATILIVMMIWYQVHITWSLAWLPFLILLTAILALGIGLGVSALGTYRHDVLFALPFVTQFWILATPIMYPLSEVPSAWQFAYKLNPMVGIIEAFRDVLVKGLSPDMSLLSISITGTVLVWLVAWPIFRFMSQYFADVL